MTTPEEFGANHLLAALPAVERLRLQPELQCVELRRDQVLCEPGLVQRYVYFPTGAIVSLSYITDSGAPAEVAVIGNEGVVGVSLFLGGGSTTSRAVVQCSGQALRVAAHTAKSLFEQSAPVRRLLLRYIQALMTQTAQLVACNRHHTIEQRLCRLLLQRLDRERGSDIATTQEQISHALGVRREGVTAAAHALQADRLIRSARGHISVLDRRRLALRSCECYAAVCREYDRLLSDLPTTRSLPVRPWARAGLSVPDVSLALDASCLGVA